MWTNIPKPTGANYTNVAKPVSEFGGETWTQMSISWQFANGTWTNSWINISKPT